MALSYGIAVAPPTSIPRGASALASPQRFASDAFVGQTENRDWTQETGSLDNPRYPAGQAALDEFYATPHGILNMEWIDASPNLADIGAQPESIQRGFPAPLSWWMKRRAPQARSVPKPLPSLFLSPEYSRGADALAPLFGTIASNPIGAGNIVPFRIPTIAGPAARYEAGVIFFDVQTVPTSIALSPTMTQESLAALLATAHVGPAYATTG